jgi:hypothetical protein
MSKEDDYRRNAAHAVKLAQHAKSTTDKGRLLALAEKWLDLADRAHILARRRSRASREAPFNDSPAGNKAEMD